MMIGSYQNPTVQIPPWPILDDPTGTNKQDYAVTTLDDGDVDMEMYGSDHFRMFEFKVRKCTRGQSHDWTECPFVHPGEKARRRDPRKFHYSGTSCPDFRKGNCKKKDACEYGHGVFECWLHPSRYRTQPCKDGLTCPRRVCFFAHSPRQLRLSSPPLSPPSPSLAATTMTRQLSMPCHHLPGSARFENPCRHGFFSLPATPTEIRGSDLFEEMERVESGRGLRARMFEKLCRENIVSLIEPPGPDIGWVSDLLK